MNRQKKLRLIISSMKQKQLLKFFDLFLQSTNCHFSKSIKQISYSCYQSTCQIENYIVNGYGKTQVEALVSGINNLVDCLVEEDGYCEGMKQAVRRVNNVSGFNYLNGLSSGNAGTCSKKLLSTEKPIKTLASQTPTSTHQKKLLTMSANMSSSSKQSSSKSKSIKQQIFEYFNLQNVKVKNPSLSQQKGQFCTLGQGGNNNNCYQGEREKRSVTTYSNNNNINTNTNTNSLTITHNNPLNQRLAPPPQQHQFNTTTNKSADDLTSQIQLVYRRIREMKQQISVRQKQNLKLKQQIHSKRTKLIITGANNNVMKTEGNISSVQNHHNAVKQQSCYVQSNNLAATTSSANVNANANANGQYFSRQSLQPKPNRKVSQPVGSQSTKKLSYLEMSLNNNDKMLTKSTQLQEKQTYNNNNNKQNILLHQQQKCGHMKKDSTLSVTNPNEQPLQQFSKQNKLISKYNLQNSIISPKQQFSVQCEFVNVELKTSISNNNNTQAGGMNGNNNSSGGYEEQQQQQQRRCLVDLTNFNNVNVAGNGNNNNGTSSCANNQKPYNLNLKCNNIIQNPLTPKSDLYHFHTFKQSPPQQLTKQAPSFQTAKPPTQHPSRHPLAFQKLPTQESIFDSSKKLRSFSVQNQLIDKVSTLKPSNPMNPLTLNSSTNCNHMNASFDNGNNNSNGVSLGLNINNNNNKKIRIPKLNLQILPNYHGKSNKSLNQSLMDNYAKTKQGINIGQE